VTIDRRVQVSMAWLETQATFKGWAAYRSEKKLTSWEESEVPSSNPGRTPSDGFPNWMNHHYVEVIIDWIVPVEKRKHLREHLRACASDCLFHTEDAELMSIRDNVILKVAELD